MTDIKVEEASDTREEQDPLLITSPEIKAEYEVSHIFACLLLCSFHRYPELCIVAFSCHSFCLPACLPPCLHETSQFHWMDFKFFYGLEACILLCIACVITDPLGLICFNTLQTGSQHIGFWLLNVADRAPNNWLLGHAMLQNTIHCSGAMLLHTIGPECFA
jgi:hypothetical protein